VYEGRSEFGFALNRPPGHHAAKDRAMGFCIFNNIAVAAHALLADGAKRILIFDWDVHHGNGTQDIFFNDPRVLFISVHQWPQYPGTGRLSEIGAGKGRGFTVNLPFPAGAADADYAAVMNRVVAPLAQEFQPEMVLVSAGFDAHVHDPLGGMRLSGDGFAHMAGCISTIAKQSGRGPCYVLEGGYHLSASADAAAKVIRATLSRKTVPILGSPSAACLKVIDAALEAHGS
jgi:acetoin utilization deacetylase AcuC-like enzyme